MGECEFEIVLFKWCEDGKQLMLVYFPLMKINTECLYDAALLH